MRNECLVIIEDMCVNMCGSLLSTLGMPAPNRSMHDAFNRELQRENNYDRDEMAERIQRNVPLLNVEQKNVYDSLIKVIDEGTGGIYFLDAPGGTGKTFVISLILEKVRSRSQIALAVASSGIAATLLEGGRTAHSALKLPLNLLTVDEPTCTVSKNSATAKLMRECKIIIWDECTMAHKRALEAVDRTMKDLRANFCEFTSSKEELITKVFPGLEQNYTSLQWISERAILAAKNKDVDSLNIIIQNQIPGELHSYKSVDSVADEDEATNYPTEFLNSLDVPGTPPHNLQLKVGSIVIMLRNLNHPKLCN
ncbi:uncharacterized protein LOC133327727, partial [Musca vetustissima]|uniref:uncharacterized protein LOC133327727 n=1 Tax=Musca vetustissima TaxID=27455 RepID=UPI002AB6FBF6